MFCLGKCQKVQRKIEVSAPPYRQKGREFQLFLTGGSLALPEFAGSLRKTAYF
jgi:hypothetical protein